MQHLKAANEKDLQREQETGSLTARGERGREERALNIAAGGHLEHLVLRTWIGSEIIHLVNHNTFQHYLLGISFLICKMNVIKFTYNFFFNVDCGLLLQGCVSISSVN